MRWLVSVSLNSSPPFATTVIGELNFKTYGFWIPVSVSNSLIPKVPTIVTGSSYLYVDLLGFSETRFCLFSTFLSEIKSLSNMSFHSPFTFSKTR